MINKTDEEYKSNKEILLGFIQHNPQHYIELKIMGKEIYPCARCFGLWIGLLIGFILSPPFWLGLFHINNFIFVFAVAWLFVIPAILDWSTVKLSLRDSNNKIRIITGFLQGLGIIIYFFILPASLIFKIVTYALYETLFYLIRWRYNINHYYSKKESNSIK